MSNSQNKENCEYNKNATASDTKGSRLGEEEEEVTVLEFDTGNAKLERSRRDQK